ncbi:MAG: undecaprenyl-diphosphatase [Planctomycetota bacterium]|jgi:undecaprenyl-diphosphatase
MFALLTQAPAEAAAAAEPATGLISVLLLAVIQGLAEFLPISSSGHLVLGRAALDVKEAGLALDVSLHVGTLAAVIYAYRRDVLRLFGDMLKGNFRMFAWLILATIPIGAIGILVKPLIEQAAQSPKFAGCGLLGTALILLLGEWKRPRAQAGESGAIDALPAGDDYWGSPSWGQALVLGSAQVIAILPGVSRSGTTISTAFALGLAPIQAARLSFLMSLPAVSGAAIVELPHVIEDGIGGIPPTTILLAIGTAALVGWAALRTLVLVLSKGAFRYFAAYCALLGGLALALL